MESIRTVWQLFLFFSLISLPQLLGVLVYFRLRRFQKLLAHILGFLTPPGLFFYFSWLFWIYVPYQNHVFDGGCGMPLLAASIMIFSGTGIQVVFSLLAQLMLGGRRRTKTAKVTL
jgi:hypothetical protein